MQAFFLFQRATALTGGARCCRLAGDQVAGRATLSRAFAWHAGCIVWLWIPANSCRPRRVVCQIFLISIPPFWEPGHGRKSLEQRKTEHRLSCISDWLILIAQDQLNISDKCRLLYPFLDFTAQPPKPKVPGVCGTSGSGRRSSGKSDCRKSFWKRQAAARMSCAP